MFSKAKGMGMKKPAGMAGVWFWGYGLDYAAVKLWIDWFSRSIFFIVRFFGGKWKTKRVI